MFEIPLRSLCSTNHNVEEDSSLRALDIEMHGREPVFIFEMKGADGRWPIYYTHIGGRLIIDPDDPSVGHPLVATLLHDSKTKGRVHIPLRKMEYLTKATEGKVCEQLICTSLHGDVITLDVEWNEETDMSWDFYTFAQAGVHTGNTFKDPLTMLFESMMPPTRRKR